jgi:hypothetical protein
MRIPRAAVAWGYELLTVDGRKLTSHDHMPIGDACGRPYFAIAPARPIQRTLGDDFRDIGTRADTRRTKTEKVETRASES